MASKKSRVKLDWNADDIGAQVIKACQAGVDTVMANCVISAKQLVRVDTTLLQGSIRFEPSKVSGAKVHGTWGSYAVDYAIYQEFGPAGGGRTWAYRPYLRPSKDKFYPTLAQEIKRRMGAK